MEALKQIDKDVAKAVRATLKVEKKYDRIKKLEKQLEDAKQQARETYRNANALVSMLADKNMDWAVYEIQEALQRGDTVEAYLVELLEHNPISYAELIA